MPQKGEAVSNRDNGPAPLVVWGDLSDRRDLIVEGSVEADATLVVRRLRIARGGSVRADVHGSTILVEGRICGDVVGEERVIVRGTGSIEGNVTTPAIALEPGARVRGNVETLSLPAPGPLVR